MPTVFNNSMVAHVWAQQTEDQGRNAGDTFYFYGPTIYSYGSHFPIAKFVTDNIVLFTTDGYSNTTAKHKSLVWQALYNRTCTIFEVPNLDIRIYKRNEAQHIKDRYRKNHNVNLAYFKKEMEDAVVSAHRAKKSDSIDYHLDRAERMRGTYNNYVLTFKLRRKPLERPDVESIIQAADEKRKKELKARKLREETQRLNLAKQVLLWRKGDKYISLWAYPDTLLRVNPTHHDIVETSRGATFPVSHALKAYKLIRACREAHKAWESNGHTIHLGHFKIDRITASGDVKAGCHFVEWAEIDRMNQILQSIAK